MDEYRNDLLDNLTRDYLTELVSEGTLDLRWLGEAFVMGLLTSTETLNEELRIIPVLLYGIVKEQLQHFPLNASSINKGNFWHYTAEIHDNFLAVYASLIDADLTNGGFKVKKIIAERQRVGYIAARQLTDYTSRVSVMAESNHPEILGYFVDLAANIIHYVKGISTEQWRQSTRAKLIPKKKEKILPVKRPEGSAATARGIRKRSNRIPSDSGAPPTEPNITQRESGERAFRGAWCQYKYDADQYYGLGKAFTHKELGEKLGISEQAAKNYYNNTWRPLNGV